MTVAAPPRPPRKTTRDDVEALIEEARQRARRRQCIYAAVVGVVAVLALAVIVVGRAADSDGASGGVADRSPVPVTSDPLTIAFVRGRPNRHAVELWAMRADGTGERRLAPRAGEPEWSPDGGLIAFARSAAEGGAYREPDLYVVDADGSDVTRLTENEPLDTSPTWSADGKRIAFSTFRHSDDNFEIYVMTSDGSGERNLTRNTARDLFPAWSPDGTKIAFLRSVDGRSTDLFVMNPDGTEQRPLATHAGPAVWSPDSRQLVFQRAGDIYVVDVAGLAARNVTRAHGADGGWFWSPDAKRVAFTSERDGNAEIYVMNADGSGLRNATRSRENEEMGSWSSDGKHIAFTRRVGTRQTDIYVMAADGADQRRLTNSPLSEWAPRWSP